MAQRSATFSSLELRGHLEAKVCIGLFLLCGVWEQNAHSGCSEEEGQFGAVGAGSSRTHRLGKGVCEKTLIDVHGV